MQHTHWRKELRLSSMGDTLDVFLQHSAFDRGPWLSVAFGTGIALWFVLPNAFAWGAVLAACMLGVGASILAWREKTNRTQLQLASISIALLVALGMAMVWTKSALAGAPPIARPTLATVDARVLERSEQPAEQRVRLVLATRDPADSRAIKVRVNLPAAADDARIGEGALIRATIRLMPPAPPMLPGAYDFARAAWFQGLAATGSVLGSVEVLEQARAEGSIARIQRALSAHVRSQLGGSAGAIAAAFASGDRGAITPADEDAMRDAGLTHLLSISGLHVSAVIAGIYFLTIRLLALWPWLALRVRLPLTAAGIAALGGIAYTLLTGAEVPTVRSCIGAVLVLVALALGREPLSLRMVAVGAFCVLLLWPEALAGPSFQMSFAAVIAIVALHSSAPVRAFLAPRNAGWLDRTARHGAMLLATGFVIELALTPIVLFHFHRAGLYGAFANVIAIPLTTFVTMPLIALALFGDLVGAGAPAWWLVGKSLDLLIALAHLTAAQPGAVKLMPQMGVAVFGLFLAGELWLALWRGRVRLLGFGPIMFACLLLLLTPTPDVLISGDGRNVGIAGEGDRLLVLHDTRSDFTRENLLELAGMNGEVMPLSAWQGARCSTDFCVATLFRGGREWTLLMARSRNMIEERSLAAACERADIVIADRYLPRSCKPRWLKADRSLLSRTGGLSVNLNKGNVRSVAEQQGEHGWWRAKTDDSVRRQPAGRSVITPQQP